MTTQLWELRDAGVNCFPGRLQSFTSLLEIVIDCIFVYGSEHVEDKPPCTHTKTRWNEPGAFGTVLVHADGVKFGDLFLFYSDIISAECSLHQWGMKKVYNSRTIAQDTHVGHRKPTSISVV